jgi:anion-transporting  ArsA/GET3 family ATPase
MTSVFDRELLVVTGKGGVGKTTLASALGLVAAERGLRTIVVEVGEQSRLPLLFGMPAPDPGDAAELEENLSSMSIDLDRALLEWLQSLGGRVSGRVLASSSTFQYFAAAAPGAKELVSMVKIWELTQGRRRRGRARSGGYDLVVLDAPATGHALGMLDSPRTFGAIARVGPIAGQAERLRELLADPDRSSYLAVAQGTEMAITETLELQQKLGKQLGRELHAVIVNGMLPQRFSAAELRQITTLGDLPTRSTATRSAIAAAQAISERARFQHNQLARLRRRHFEVIGVPFQFTAELDLDAVRHIAEQLKRKL